MKKIILSLTALLLSFGYGAQGKIDMHGKEQTQKAAISYGKVLEITPVMGYKYLKVDENGTQRWVAIASAPVKVGDTIGYDKRTVMKDFKSKALGKTFKEIIFANDVYLPQKATAPGSLKSMLGLDKKDPHAGLGIKQAPQADEEEKPAKPFVQKSQYTVEEVHMWRKSLSGKRVKVKGKIYKVSRNIMKRDWIHLGDGTGNEKKLTDDLVFTAVKAPVKAGDEVIATGKVTVDKDFGYGYFYRVIMEDASFEPVK
jgi:predicted heme/steroid binding protein